VTISAELFFLIFCLINIGQLYALHVSVCSGVAFQPAHSIVSLYSYMPPVNFKHINTKILLPFGVYMYALSFKTVNFTYVVDIISEYEIIVLIQYVESVTEGLFPDIFIM
jgi:hypothetical protein